MMGRRAEQAALFYEFHLEERVPADHLLRRVDAVLDLSWVRGHMAGALQRHGATVGLPRADGAHAAGRATSTAFGQSAASVRRRL